MPTRKQPTVTQNNIAVSISSGWLPNPQVILNVSRHYKIKNSFGGIGVSKPLDYNGKVFDNEDAAWKFALAHGYTKIYYPKGMK